MGKGGSQKAPWMRQRSICGRGKILCGSQSPSAATAVGSGYFRSRPFNKLGALFGARFRFSSGQSDPSITFSMIYLICKRLFAFDMRRLVPSNRPRLNSVSPLLIRWNLVVLRVPKIGSTLTWRRPSNLPFVVRALATSEAWKPISPS